MTNVERLSEWALVWDPNVSTSLRTHGHFSTPDPSHGAHTFNMHLAHKLEESYQLLHASFNVFYKQCETGILEKPLFKVSGC